MTVAPWFRWTTITVAIAIGGYVAVQAATWPPVASMAGTNPAHTAFIDRYQANQKAAGKNPAVAWTWAPLDRISIHLQRAVVVAEDIGFFSHHGFDIGEMRLAMREALEAGESLRGASTLSQQVAKNLWLSPSRNPLRKVKEAILTYQLERKLSKQRILELYLNIAELGPATYGAEAAARRYFGKSAADLTEHEAAQLAAGLSRPSRWNPGSASQAYATHVGRIEGRMLRAQFLWRRLGGSPPATVGEALTDSLGGVDSMVDSMSPVDSATLTAPPLEEPSTPDSTGSGPR